MNQLHKELLVGLFALFAIIGFFGSLIYLGISTFHEYPPFGYILGTILGALGVSGLHMSYMLVYHAVEMDRKNKPTK